MQIFSPPRRPRASSTCSRCRTIVVWQEQDLNGRQDGVLEAACPACQGPLHAHIPWIQDGLRRDQAAR